MVAFFVGVGIGLVAVCAFIIFYYNRLVTLNHRVDNAWSQIDVQLARRASLIPSLVKLVDAPQKNNSELVAQAEGIYREMQGGTKDVDFHFSPRPALQIDSSLKGL